jgi:hypothetical protein
MSLRGLVMEGMRLGAWGGEMRRPTAETGALRRRRLRLSQPTK